MFDRFHEDGEIIHEPVYLCNDCGEESPHSELFHICCSECDALCPYCESDDLEEL
ncbi:structural protein [Acinetobacter phage vB_AbaP_Acibel007]|uniref:Structural protein n=1 Tax=Acinetobacter phage vB_AbaP_Acibel007 TaxID=1481187 RepID=A0A075DXY0_9CAUD|nr:structural protein [Acinetobacter phage vB_AbaP_Acibel007]AHY26776.1 structural protein [Acinetobacter phage vB_AbaP_Acibel007]